MERYTGEALAFEPPVYDDYTQPKNVLHKTLRQRLFLNRARTPTRLVSTPAYTDIIFRGQRANFE